MIQIIIKKTPDRKFFPKIVDKFSQNISIGYAWSKNFTAWLGEECDSLNEACEVAKKAFNRLYCEECDSVSCTCKARSRQ